MAAWTASPPSSHYASQAGLSVAFLRALDLLWPRLEQNRQDFRLRLYALVTKFSQASSTLAAQEYAAQRREASVRGAFTVPHAAPADVRQFDSNLNWALADLEQTPDVARTKLEGAMSRLVSQAGRETVADAVASDPKARAWARETRGDCCAFCALMASRGAVYKTEQTAGKAADTRFEGEGEFKFHDNCHCVAVPVFGAFEMTADARRWESDYFDLKKKLGHSPNLNQWRQSFEGRRVKGLPDDESVQAPN